MGVFFICTMCSFSVFFPILLKFSSMNSKIINLVIPELKEG
ncbi:hypothetical protein BAXH7_03110 [Bacillus amyloliquefaciens XH7]|nr:hypothetical protein LL3_03174 [Bacillus amyloliquefaciens LL3]AEK90230.1 hypothetical protein BAXH7_03110 [Bacillus amyloliquefaciens XH7]